MKKILYTATSDIHLRTFHFPYLKWLINEGYEVHAACENRANVDLSFCHQVHYFPFKRNPLHPKNIQAYRDLRKLIEKNQYHLIHCHTPTVSVLTRLAAIHTRIKGTKVLYTAHGYHFYKGAPLKMWLVFYPIEKLLSYVTDGIILINKEDYQLTQQKFNTTKAFYIKGIGIDSDRFKQKSLDEKEIIREGLGIKKQDFVLLYIAEFIDRKNHEFLLRSIADLIPSVPNLKVLLAGKGVLLDSMKKLAFDLEINNNVKFLGWRDDAHLLAAIADIGISTSKQEGLGLGLAEEMLCGVPIIASQDRGHREMVAHGVNGYLFDQGNQEEFIKHIVELESNESKRLEMGSEAYQKAQEFLIENSLNSMAEIYNQFLK